MTRLFATHSPWQHLLWHFSNMIMLMMMVIMIIIMLQWLAPWTIQNCSWTETVRRGFTEWSAVAAIYICWTSIFTPTGFVLGRGQNNNKKTIKIKLKQKKTNKNKNKIKQNKMHFILPKVVTLEAPMSHRRHIRTFFMSKKFISKHAYRYWSWLIFGGAEELNPCRPCRYKC